MARPWKFKTVAEMESRINEYFDVCEQKRVPPTVTGLALFLGLQSRQALLNYQGRGQFNDAITRSLTNNFKGWSEKPDKPAGDGGVTIVDDIP